MVIRTLCLVVFISMVSPGALQACWSPDQWSAQNQVAISQIRSQIGLPLVERPSGSQAFDAPEETVITGVPNFVRVISASQISVLRHYTPPEKYELIKKTGGLIAGPTPYIVKGGGYKKTYESLTGVFFTTPQYKPEQVGLGKEVEYVALDIQLPAKLEILFLEPGIYLVPGPGLLPGWIRQAYLEWKKTGVEPTLKMLLGVFARIDAQGGLLEPLCVPL